MSSTKRKLNSLGLQRRVRARHEEEWEPEQDLEQSSKDESPEQGASEEEGEDDETGSDDGSEASEQDAGTEADDHFSSISFGALARAQNSLPPPKRKVKPGQAAAEEASSTTARGEQSLKRGSSSKTHKQDLAKRSSKHAPQEVSSKKPVSRRREVIADPRRKARDPRFDPLAGKVDEAKMAKAYSFLDEYRESEMADLRTQIKKTKNADEKESLKRQLMSMESRKKARQKKDEEAKVLNEHRQKEKELVAQGKKPFYLKQSEQKKQFLVNRYANMSKGQVDKAIERKRKKVASKEKRELASLERINRRH